MRLGRRVGCRLPLLAAAAAGATALMLLRDSEIIDAADEAGLAMVFTAPFPPPGLGLSVAIVRAA
jgi:hypothetical protein